MNVQSRVESWRRRTRQKLMYAFGGKCGICDYDRCNSALHLHHVNPDEKEFGIGTSLKNNISWERLLSEAKKCVLLCSNCHMEVHEGIIDIPPDIQRFDDTLLNETDMYDFCPDCGKKKSINFEFCSRECAGRNNATHQKIDWDNIDVVTLYTEMRSYAAVGRKLGCSGAAVRKRIKRIESSLT